MSSTEKIPMRQLFSERLRMQREQRMFKSADMADFLGFSPPVYSRYENGRIPDVDTVAVIADRCGVTVDWLLGRENSMSLTRETHKTGQTDLACENNRKGTCQYPADCDLPGQIRELREDYKAIQETLSAMAAQMETVTTLLGHALGRHLAADEMPRKVG
jgi:transcriptional regulator with XRE-family HTH domain